MDDFTLRHSKKSDLNFIVSLIESTFKSHIITIWGNWDKESQYDYWSENLHPSIHKIIVIDTVDAGLLSVIEDADNIDLDLIFLMPKFQNKGIGKRIVESIIYEADKKSKLLTVKVLRSNIRALRFYEGLGFRIIKETKERFYLKYIK